MSFIISWVDFDIGQTSAYSFYFGDFTKDEVETCTRTYKIAAKCKINNKLVS